MKISLYMAPETPVASISRHIISSSSGMLSQNPWVECQVVTMRGDASIGVKSSSEMDKLEVVEESVSMSSDEAEGLLVPALNGRADMGGVVMIWFSSEETGNGGGGMVPLTGKDGSSVRGEVEVDESATRGQGVLFVSLRVEAGGCSEEGAGAAEEGFIGGG
jgi:hypothetical protein